MKIQDKTQFAAADAFGIGTPNTAYARYFTGHSYLKALTPAGVLPCHNVTGGLTLSPDL